MFGPLGFPEVLFILGLALLVFGPKRLPELGRTLGRGLSEFRKASNELKRSINTELALEEERGSWADTQARWPAVAAASAPSAPPEEPQGSEAGGEMEATPDPAAERLAPVHPVADPRAEPRSFSSPSAEP